MKKYIRAAISSDMPQWLEERLRKSKGYRDKLNDAGYDIQNLHVSETPKPDSVPVYFIDYTLYIPGVNDDETIWINNRQRTLGKMARKTLEENATHIAYLDKASSIKPAKERYYDPREYNVNNRKYNWQKGYAGQRQSSSGKWVTEQGRDKSGYVIPDPTKKLRQFYLNNMDKLAGSVEDLYSDLTDIKQKLFDIDIREGINDDPYSTDYDNMLSRFGTLARNYRILLKDIGNLSEDMASGDEWSKYEVNRSVDTIHDIRRAIDRLKKALETGRYW